MKRELFLNLRFNETEKNTLSETANRLNMNSSSFIRLSLRNMYNTDLYNQVLLKERFVNMRE